MDSERRGEVVTFFSFKGGTGRTMALANVAWILASRGKRVLVVDWDLDSPGLHKFFAPFLDADLYDATDGIVDIIAGYAREATKAVDRDPDWHLEHARVLPHAISLTWKFPDGGALDIISAGRPGNAHSTVLPGFSWDNFYYRLGGGLLLEATRDDMRANYDYTLIDSRTGLSDIAGICTVRFPDTVVNCFTLSNQSIEGAARAARSIGDLSIDRTIRVLPVPMRVEDAEKAKLAMGLSYARGLFEGYPRGLDDEAVEQYWASIPIPYQPYYAYEEVLATFADDPHGPRTLLAAYERLASAVTLGAVRDMPALASDVRQRITTTFERRRRVTAADVFLSYVPEDRMWADWISGVLRRAGVRVTAQGADLAAGADVAVEVQHAAEAAGYTMVLLSPAYIESRQARSVWDVVARAESEGSRRSLIPVRVAEVRLRAPFDAWHAVDLVRLEEPDAAAAVLHPLNLAPRPADEAPQARFPGARPPVWGVVPTRNAGFTGRSPLLQKLRDELSIGSAVVKPLALHGLGGVGKTQLAVEYTYRFQSDYDVVWWVSAQDVELITSGLADLAPALRIRRGDSMAEAAEAVLEALRLGEPYSRWLVVFDNAEDPEVLQPFLPQGNGHVLITSRNPLWARFATPVEVAVFTRDESVDLLSRRAPSLTWAAASDVAEYLGDLPLAVDLAGAWLETTGMPVPDYLTLLREGMATWLSSSIDSDTTRDYSSITAAWRVSIERLRQERPAAVRLLELCSCFGPEPISMSLLYSDETFNALLPHDEALQEKMMLGRIIREIGRYALARVDQQRSSIEVHRLVQTVVRASMEPQKLEDTKHEVHRILASARPRQGDLENPDSQRRYNEIWPHLGPSDAQTCIEEIVRTLMVERVRYLWRLGDYGEALTLARSLEKTWERERGADDRQLLSLRFNVANILRSQGEYQAAYEVDEDVLRRQTAAFGADFIHSLITAGSLTADLLLVGRHQEAVELARRTRDSFVLDYGEEEREALNAGNNLALALRFNGEYEKAKDLDQRVYDVRQIVLGRQHPRTWLSAQVLAADLRNLGRFEESVTLLRATLVLQQEAFGAGNPDTRRTIASLAVGLRKLGRHEEARALSTDLLQQYERSPHRGDEPDLLACQLYVASDLAACNEAEAALERSRATTDAYGRRFGDGHVYTLISSANTALYLRQVRRTAEARLLAERTWTGLRETLGEAHPVVLVCAVNLASARAEDGDLAAAAALEVQTDEALTRVLGERHPETLLCRCNRALTLRAQGRPGADTLRAASLAVLEEVLGPEHPHLDLPRHWRRVDRDLEPTVV